MTKEQNFYCLGSGWISAFGNGVYGSQPRFSYENTQFDYPTLEEFINTLPPRYGRFDVYTKVTFTTAVLALKDASLLQNDIKRNIGIVIGSSSNVYDNDLAYFASTREAKGAFTSPNLFSYTLPNVALGEIAVYFKFIGPTFCVGNDSANPGRDVIPAALSLIESKQCDSILTGWVEVAQNQKNYEIYPKGAAFAVLTLKRNGDIKKKFSYNRNFNFVDLIKG